MRRKVWAGLSLPGGAAQAHSGGTVPCFSGRVVPPVVWFFLVVGSAFPFRVS
uniref:Uncharacterized protein n=1 Tax=Setaria italica TaxID=4555 RepID=K4A090_SETIT